VSAFCQKLIVDNLGALGAELEAIDPLLIVELYDMKKNYGALAALSALATSLAGAPMGAEAQEIPGATPVVQIPRDMAELLTDVDRLRNQCDYIWDNRTNVGLLTAELDRILNSSPNVQTCTTPMSPEMQRSCEQDCTGLILALLGGDPVAQLISDDPY
jgi:hypothetical protein